MVIPGKEGEQQTNLFELERTLVDSPQTFRIVAELLTSATPQECAEYIRTPLAALLENAWNEMKLPLPQKGEVTRLSQDFNEKHKRHSGILMACLKGLINEWIFISEGGAAPTLFHPFSLGERHASLTPNVDRSDPFPFIYSFLFSEGEWYHLWEFRFDPSHKHIDWLFHPPRILAQNWSGNVFTYKDKFECKFKRGGITFFERTRSALDAVGYIKTNQIETLKINPQNK